MSAGILTQQASTTNTNGAANADGTTLHPAPLQQQQSSGAATDAIPTATLKQHNSTDAAVHGGTSAAELAQAVAQNQTDKSNKAVSAEPAMHTLSHPQAAGAPPVPVDSPAAAATAAATAGRDPVNDNHVIGEVPDQRATQAASAATPHASPVLPNQAAADIGGHPVGEELDNRSSAQNGTASAAENETPTTAEEHVPQPSMHVVGEEMHEAAISSPPAHESHQIDAGRSSAAAGEAVSLTAGDAGATAGQTGATAGHTAATARDGAATVDNAAATASVTAASANGKVGSELDDKTQGNSHSSTAVSLACIRFVAGPDALIFASITCVRKYHPISYVDVPNWLIVLPPTISSMHSYICDIAIALIEFCGSHALHGTQTASTLT